ncbi:MAG: SUMF1/EgtB/PvdO family nonheme iron enzyme [Marinicellaceae bacterium]
MAIHALKANYLLGEYRIEKLLGEGGFGLTYLAFDTHLDKKVAIKEYMPSEHAVRKQDSQIVAKSKSSKTVYDWGLNAFLNEAKTLAKFEDSNIVRIYRFFEANGTAYIVMEYCEGGCLIDKVSKTKPMSEAQLIPIISAISHGLQLVHNDGILHRDIKPDNIMFRLDGTPVLIDFGAARQAIGTKSRKVTTIITPGYAPLEQYSSNGAIGPWSDIYSLSAVAYLCLTGKRPPDIMNRLHEDTIKKLSQKQNASPFLQSIDKGLELQVTDRPQNLSEWSSKWNNFQKPEFKHHSLQTNAPPIYASKEVPNAKENIATPISARTSLNPYEETIVNVNSVEINHNKKSGFGKLMMTLIFLGLIGVGGFFGYDYLDKDKLKSLFNGSEKVEELNDVSLDKALIEKVQINLNVLGYKVPENGVLNTRTIESIKDFEIKKNMVVTGTVDKTLLDELKSSIMTQDKLAWKVALQQNTIKAYNSYLSDNPNGAYTEQVPVLIEEIKSFEKKKQELEALQQSETNKNKALSAQLEQEQKDQLMQQKILILDIQSHLKRLKFSYISENGELEITTKNAIKMYQKLKNIVEDGLPSKTLLFLLSEEEDWPGRKVGDTFKDCQDCPTMVVISAGQFTMGSVNGNDNEKPQHQVYLREFILSESEITFAQWKKCVDDKVCTHNPQSSDLQFENQAVMRVNMNDVNEYLEWINSKTSKNYRLPSEAEWEYAARAGSTTAYSWGDEIGNDNVICDGCSNNQESKYLINSIKNFPANNFGLYDMHGNVWEWTADCWHNNYLGAPSDNSPWEPIGCDQFVVRGGSGGNKPMDLRSANRGAMKADKRLNSLGFRVALDLE